MSADRLAESVARWNHQYAAIRGQPYGPPHPQKQPTYLGVLPREALLRFVRAAIDPMWPHPLAVEPPLGPSFDRALWSLAPTGRPVDPTIAAVVELAQNEFRSGRHAAAAAVARLVRARVPDEPEPQRLLSLVGAWLEGPAAERRADYHLALGDAHRLLGENDRAAVEYQAAL